MNHTPDMTKTVQLSTGKDLNMIFDHPNHAGFDTTDHKLAADYHHRQAKAQNKNFRAARYHFAQRDLHEMASQGKPTKIQHVPSESTISMLPTSNKDFWRKKAKETSVNNEKLKTLEPYRMTSVLSGTPQPDHDPIKNVFNAAKALSKSKDVDFDLAKRVELDRDPPKPALSAVETKNSVQPEYKELLDTIMAQRKAVRHGDSNPNNVQDGVDPRKLITPEQLGAIRQAIANRSRGG